MVSLSLVPGPGYTSPRPRPRPRQRQRLRLNPTRRSRSRSRRQQGTLLLSPSTLRLSSSCHSSSSDRDRDRDSDSDSGGGGDEVLCGVQMGCGTWAWGNKLLWEYDADTMDGELNKVFDLHVATRKTAFFDTGDSYGTGKLEGRSEQLLGQFRTARTARRTNIRPAQGKDSATSSGSSSGSPEGSCVFGTKLAVYPWRLTSESLVRACEASRERMRVEQIELAQLHWSAANYAPLQERALWKGMGDIKERGLAKAVGVSNYGPKQLKKIHAYLAGRGVPLATCQVQLSLLSYDELQKEVLAVCEELDIKVISYSPLALGLLTNKYAIGNKEGKGMEETRLPGGLRGLVFRNILPGIRPLLSELVEVAEDTHATPSQVAIAWCMSKGTIPIPGAKNLSQAKQNIGSLDVNLSDLHCQALEAAAQKCSSKMVQNIFQTG